MKRTCPRLPHIHCDQKSRFLWLKGVYWGEHRYTQFPYPPEVSKNPTGITVAVTETISAAILTSHWVAHAHISVRKGGKVQSRTQMVCLTRMPDEIKDSDFRISSGMRVRHPRLWLGRIVGRVGNRSEWKRTAEGEGREERGGVLLRRRFPPAAVSRPPHPRSAPGSPS